MSLGILNTREIHEAIDNEDDEEQAIVNHCYQAVVETLKKTYKRQTAGDDRAEELVAAIYHYMKSCNEPTAAPLAGEALTKRLEELRIKLMAEHAGESVGMRSGEDSDTFDEFVRHVAKSYEDTFQQDAEEFLRLQSIAVPAGGGVETKTIHAIGAVLPTGERIRFFGTLSDEEFQRDCPALPAGWLAWHFDADECKEPQSERVKEIRKLSVVDTLDGASIRKVRDAIKRGQTAAEFLATVTILPEL